MPKFEINQRLLFGQVAEEFIVDGSIDWSGNNE